MNIVIHQGRAIEQPRVSARFSIARKETLSIIRKCKEPKSYETPRESVPYSDLSVKELQLIIINLSQKKDVLCPVSRACPRYLKETLTKLTNNRTFIDLDEVRRIRSDALFYLTRKLRPNFGMKLAAVKELFAKPRPSLLSLAYIEAQNKLGRKPFFEYGRVPAFRI